MSGRGKIDNESNHFVPRVYVFGNDYRWHKGREPVDSPIDQVDTVSIDSRAGFGPGMVFARELLSKDSTMLPGLIPCAKGGSMISEWKRDTSRATLYGSMLHRTRIALQVGKIGAILWFQGESDALDPDHKEVNGRKVNAENWNRLFEEFVSNIRRDLELPDLKVVFAQIGTIGSRNIYPGWEVVKSRQENVSILNVAMIKTDDLELSGDMIHFTTASYIEIGKRFGAAYLRIVTE